MGIAAPNFAMLLDAADGADRQVGFIACDRGQCHEPDKGRGRNGE
jgi:hypothetical protein